MMKQKGAPQGASFCVRAVKCFPFLKIMLKYKKEMFPKISLRIF